MAQRLAIFCAVSLALTACGDSYDDVANDKVGVTDAAPGDRVDARPGECVPGPTECTNCVDDDDDGLVDGFDPECTGALDDDESSFGTGVQGDNQNPKIQDCFFDGNSGGGDDGCAYHTCCQLDTGGPFQCPAWLQPPTYHPEDCTISAECIANCAPLTPPGCDCFGCCTICYDGECRDVLTNPAVAPACAPEVITDPGTCPPCVKADCGGDCDPLECILCPGQTEDDLPPQCEENECPGGQSNCATSTDCAAGQFCSAGCCIDGIG